MTLYVNYHKDYESAIKNLSNTNGGWPVITTTIGHWAYPNNRSSNLPLEDAESFALNCYLSDDIYCTYEDTLPRETAIQCIKEIFGMKQ